MTAQFIASVAHEVNRAYCISIGDKSQPTWEEAPQWQKDSAIAGVLHHLANPDSTPEDSHKSWLKHKQEDGWVHGPVKDPVLKQHPCMVPYDELPQEQKSKDYLFTAVVKALTYLVPSTRSLEVMDASFNHKEGVHVAEAELKSLYALLWSKIDQLSAASADKLSKDPEAKGTMRRNASIAKTELETSQMYAVKAVTR